MKIIKIKTHFHVDLPSVIACPIPGKKNDTTAGSNPFFIFFTSTSITSLITSS